MLFDFELVRSFFGDDPIKLRWEGPIILRDIEDNPKLIKREVGVYKFKQKNVSGVWYVGRAIEYKNGGLRKRLRDYVRADDSGRKTGIGPDAYTNRDSVRVWVMYTGEDARAALIARILEWVFIGKLKPSGNTQKI